MSDLRVTREAARAARSRQLAGRQLFRRGALPARDSELCSHAARATSATSSRSRRSATTTRCRRRAKAARCVRTPGGLRAGLQRLPPPPGGHAARPRQHRQRTSSARCTAGPTTSTASCSARRTSPTTRACDLANYPLQTWNGMVFDTPASGRDVAGDLARASARARARLRRLRASTASTLHECDYNWKTFIEVYLEDYHVGPFHPGPRPASSPATTCAGSSAPHHSVQTVGVEERAGQAGLARLPQVARRRAAPTARALDDAVPRHGAIWLTYYPSDRWSSGTRTCWSSRRSCPKGPQKTLNVVEFYYPEEIARVRARVRRGRAGGVLGDLRRGRRDRAAHGRRPARPARARRRRRRARTRARWKTACSSSTSGTRRAMR